MTDLRILYSQQAAFNALQNLLKGDNAFVHLPGITGSSLSVLLANIQNENSKIHIIVCDDKESASYLANDLLNLLPEDVLYFFPSSYKRPGHADLIDESGMIQRTELLNAMVSIPERKGCLIITYSDALAEKVTSRGKLSKNTLNLSVGEKISIDFLKDALYEYQFQRVDFVYGPGQYSVRGSIVDVFSYADVHPYRIDFFGDEVDSIRKFDIENQLSLSKIEHVVIVPDMQKVGSKESSISLLEFLPDRKILWFMQAEQTCSRMQALVDSPWHHTDDSYEDEVCLAPELLTSAEFVAQIRNTSVVELKGPYLFTKAEKVHFNTAPQPSFNKNFELLAQNIHQRQEDGFEVCILSENSGQFDRLKSIFESIDKEVHFTPLSFTLHEGFVDNDLKICLYTDHQIFERFHKYKIQQKFTRAEALTLSELTDLHPGDYVVHIDHGIGKFGGIEKVETNGKWQEVIKLVYQDNDVLYISIHSIHRISKYKSKEGSEPKIYKLGSGAWQKLKATTKSKVKDIAKDLIKLYAKRKESKGFQFSADTYMQQELEASFIYEDTPDQEKATRAVKKAMEVEMPMDMLVCGDVGFGKTEVAIRAAFKAVADSKQVAVLVPTTILALQHFKTFSERLKGLPCNVDYINRFKSAKEQKETLKNLAEGRVDILIGTHRLVSADVKFKDLGLLIVDEEQKFGVAVKEKLKNLKANVDTLTLTATPIPRTLQFSLMGARDLAIISTPPPNRHPIVTEMHTFNEDIIREAINYEISRGGQVFFINNRIQNIFELERAIKNIVPSVRTVVAHGQLEGDQLEKIILGFIAGDFDVLIATSIIESGLDIPNANTIFINDAHHFGLSDMHQLRGRVGRSNRKAFCYLLVPPINTLTQEARRRLKALEDFSELGSGFSIAMQDLDIRGAGNLLGAEQSGFIAEIGFETYQRILNEAILELKETEFKELFTDEPAVDGPIKNVVEDQRYVTDCQIDTDMEIMIPEFYVENISERIKLYRELDNAQDEESLREFEHRLSDRFGELPTPVLEMLNVVRLRQLAMRIGIERILLKNSAMVVYFVSNPQSPYYQSHVFLKLIQFVQKQPRVFQLKENKDKFSMSTANVTKVGRAIELLGQITQSSQ